MSKREKVLYPAIPTKPMDIDKNYIMCFLSEKPVSVQKKWLNKIKAYQAKAGKGKEHTYFKDLRKDFIKEYFPMMTIQRSNDSLVSMLEASIAKKEEAKKEQANKEPKDETKE